MPRGRHRHSPPLHRLLPPSTVAGVSIACAAGAWFVGDDLVQRVLAAGAAAAALTGAVLLRSWDRKAGRRVAELTRARVRDEWRTEERIAELETDVEESREIRARLDTKLRAKRAELARLRSEHAELLRRYATAETERASALEGRRLLAIEAAAPAKALPAVADRLPARREPATTPDAPTPAAATYAQADQALRQLARNAARQRAAQQAARTSQGGGALAEAAARPAPSADRNAQNGQKSQNGQTAQGSQGSQSSQGGANDRGNAQGSQGSQGGADDRGNAQAAAAERTGGADDARTATAAGPALRPVPAAAAAIAPSRPAASRELGGFDFFGSATASGPRQLTAPLADDLADVVGDEALAEQSAHADAGTQPPAKDAAAEGEESGALAADGATTSGAGEVIDLTAHDETEQLDLGALRSAIS